MEAFLTRHLAGPPDQRLGLADYHAGQLLHYDDERERGLFREPGQERPTWCRSHFTKTKRVKVEEQHDKGCTGYLPEHEKPLSFIGRRLMRCKCPVSVEFREFVWMVSPRHVSVQMKDEEVTHLGVAKDGEGYEPCM